MAINVEARRKRQEAFRKARTLTPTERFNRQRTARTLDVETDVGGGGDIVGGGGDTTAPFDINSIIGGGFHRSGNPFLRRFTKDINSIEELKDKIAQSDDLVILKQVWDDILAFNENPNAAAQEIGSLIRERTLEVGDIDPTLEGVDEFKLAAEGITQRKEIEDLSDTQRDQIDAFAKQFGIRGKDLAEILAGREETARGRFSENLDELGAGVFDFTQAGRFEGLNRGGLFTSESAVANAQVQALKQIELSKLGELGQFDVESLRRTQGFDQGLFGAEQDIRLGGLNTFIGGNQAALDTELGFQTAGLQRGFDVADANRVSASSSRNRRSGIINALIGGVTSIGLAPFTGGASLAGLPFALSQFNNSGGFGGGGGSPRRLIRDPNRPDPLV